EESPQQCLSQPSLKLDENDNVEPLKPAQTIKLHRFGLLNRQPRKEISTGEAARQVSRSRCYGRLLDVSTHHSFLQLKRPCPRDGGGRNPSQAVRGSAVAPHFACTDAGLGPVKDDLHM